MKVRLSRNISRVKSNRKAFTERENMYEHFMTKTMESAITFIRRGLTELLKMTGNVQLELAEFYCKPLLTGVIAERSVAKNLSQRHFLISLLVTLWSS
jgi:hypothetical protein